MAAWHTATANVSDADRRTAILRFSSSLLASTQRALLSPEEEAGLEACGRLTPSLKRLAGSLL